MKKGRRASLSQSSIAYSDELYKDYLKDPSLVDSSWRWFFQGLDAGFKEGTVSSSSLEKELGVFQLFQHYRNHGNLKARLDPLGENKNKGFPDLSHFGLKESDLEKQFFISEHLFSLKRPLKEVISFLESKYCDSLSLQVGVCSPKVRAWFFNEFEKKDFSLSHEEKFQAFKKLSQAEALEKFLHFRFLGKKRFSLEGLDALIPMLDYFLEKGASLDMKNLVLGMSHRGRINVLINILGKNPQYFFSEFGGFDKKLTFDQGEFTGDVKYHLGFSSTVETKKGEIDIQLGYNPSHLEVINPVILGACRAIQRENKDMVERKTAVPFLIHGDASFTGQGSVSETLQLSKLKGYRVGGAIHIILNNQVGFTTNPEEGRSSVFASTLAQSISAPVLLVNADDLFACLKAMDIATRYRHEFGEDVFIDLIGYRRFGHNEGDEPSFTQPLMYQKIKSHPTLLEIYKEKLENEDFKKEELEKEMKEPTKRWEKDLEIVKTSENVFTLEDYTGKKKKEVLKACPKNPDKEDLQEVLNLICEVPEDLKIHPKVEKILTRRKKDFEEDKLDWASCELAAYGTLIKEGFSVRLTGQDSIRGTFSHRHAFYYDTVNEEAFSPIKKMAKSLGREFCVYNSSLSELAVMAFEYGNSCLAPDFLTLWEAQFGDFVNGAQILIDQFLSSAEYKWHQGSDMVLLLPHGLEGQGPEHSSAYLERFLQLAAQQNMRICNLTKASQIFHVLRRQKTDVKERKPLIIMSPKSLLRHPEVSSSKKDLLEGQFEPILEEGDLDPRDISTVILCSGKVYYDLKVEKEKLKDQDKKKVAVFRLEELYPFPEAKLNPILNGFPGLKRLIWLQEEPKNRGAYFYVKNKIDPLVENLGLDLKMTYCGRAKMAASSEGSEKEHKINQKALITKALSQI